MSPPSNFPSLIPHCWLAVSPAASAVFAVELNSSPHLQQPWLLMRWSEVKSLSRVWFFATPWTVAYQAPLSMEFSRQEYWSGLPFPSPGDLPYPSWIKVFSTHSSILAWRIPWTEEPGRLKGSQRVRHDWSDVAAAATILIARIILFSTWTLVTLQNKNQILWLQILSSFSQSFRFIGSYYSTHSLTQVLCLTDYREASWQLLLLIMISAATLSTVWSRQYFWRMCDRIHLHPRAGSVKKREVELSLSLHMEDWKLDAVLIYVCFTHSLFYYFSPFVIDKIQCVCVFSVTSVMPDTLRPVHRILQARKLEWVAMPSSRGSFWPRDWTHVSCVSCTAGRFFTHCTTWETQNIF